MARDQQAQTHLQTSFDTAEPGVFQFRVGVAGTLAQFRVDCAVAPAGGSVSFTLWKITGGVSTSIVTLLLASGATSASVNLSQAVAVGDLISIDMSLPPSPFGDPLSINVDIAETGASATDAFLLSRANHTGSQSAASISDLLEAVQDIMAASLSQGSNISIAYDDSSGTITIASTATGLQPRATVSYTTAALADNGTETFSVPMGKSVALISTETNFASWIRVYGSVAERASDATRLITDDPVAGSGVFIDEKTSALALIISHSPVVFICSHESVPTTSVPVSLTNISGATHAITVTFVFLKVEA